MSKIILQYGNLGIIIRQSIYNTIISYVGVALGFVTNVLLYPQILTADQFGLTQVLISFALIYGQFSQLGIRQIVLRYFPYFENKDKNHHGMLFLVLLGSTLGFILFLVVFLIFRPFFESQFIDQSPLFAEFILYSLPVIFAILYFENLNNYIKSQLDTIFGSFINEVFLRILMIASVILYHFDLVNFEEFLICFVASYMMQPIAAALYLVYLGEFSLKPDFSFLKSRLMKSMLFYGLFSLLASFTTQLLGNIDSLMLGSLSGLASVAFYMVAYNVASMIAIPQRSITKIAVPVVAKAFKRKDFHEIGHIYKESSFNQILAGVLIYVGVCANLHNFFDLLPSGYEAGSMVIITLGAARIYDMATGINSGIIQVSKYYRFDLIAKVFLAIIAVITNILLIPPFGIMGAAIATGISIVLYNSIKLIFVWRKFGLQPFKARSFYLLIFGALGFFASWLIPYLGSFFVDLLLRSVVITVVYVGLIFIFKLSDDIPRLFGNAFGAAKNFLTGGGNQH